MLRFSFVHEGKYLRHYVPQMGALPESSEALRAELHASRRAVLLPTQGQGHRRNPLQR